MYYYDIFKEKYVEDAHSSSVTSFEVLKQGNHIIRKGWSASIVDMGDEVVGVEFDSVLKKELNPIDVYSMLQ